jgi:hypothetical protein
MLTSCLPAPLQQSHLIHLRGPYHKGAFSRVVRGERQFVLASLECYSPECLSGQVIGRGISLLLRGNVAAGNGRNAQGIIDGP